MTPIASVVIPAHNEYLVIDRCLDALIGNSQPGEFEVVVACNGCTDGTASLVRDRFQQVAVVEIDESSKAAALNAGDAVATAFPRIYLDADIELSTVAARALVTALTGGAKAGAPRPDIDLSERGFLVRAFYNTWLRSPFMSQHVIGNGVYALNAEGRARFDKFPSLMGDDLHVHSLFSIDERVTLEDEAFVLRPPKDLRSLLKVRSRVYLGNAQMAATGVAIENSTAGSVGALVRSTSTTRQAVDLVIYLAVNSVAKLRAKRQLARNNVVWERDDTSRS